MGHILCRIVPYTSYSNPGSLRKLAVPRQCDMGLRPIRTRATLGSGLTETEIFDCLFTNLRLAAEHCEKLAVLPRTGPTYVKLREELQLIEGCCRQANYWRADTRWLKYAYHMGEAHRLAGNWLRGIKVGPGPRRRIPPGQRHPMFMALSAALRCIAERAAEIKDKRTGKLGPILPIMRPGPHRDTRPVQVLLPPGFERRVSGLIAPADLPA
jgi:hypothetical protein